MLIDSHCHLEPSDFGEERDQVIARARAAGVSGLICIGSGHSLDEVRNAVALAETHSDIWAAVGIHPHDASRMAGYASDGTFAEIERLALGHPRVVAVGETGLDYHYHHSSKEEQQAALRTFIDLARRSQKPLSLHIRDAHDDALAICQAERAGEIGGAVHCFTGTRDEAERWVALGFHISFSGAVTFKSAEQIRQAAAWVPIERLLVETDCPYLAPVPMRGRRNEPAYLVHTAQLIAEVRGMSYEALAQAATANTRRRFLTTP
jgi:TatD DNase family protein